MLNDKILGIGRKKFFFSLRVFLYALVIFILFYGPKRLISYEPVLIAFKLVFDYFSIYFVFWLIRYFVVLIYKKKNHYEKDYVDNIIIAINRLGFLFVNIVFFFVFLDVLGLKIGELLTSISIFAVALVLIFKDYIANLLNGLTIMFSKDYKIKEYVQIGNNKGKINDITFSNVELKTDEGDIVFIPNSKFLTSEVINFSKTNLKKIKYSFSLPFSYYNLIFKLEEEILKRLCEQYSMLSLDNISFVVSDFKKDEILFTIDMTVSKYNFKLETDIKKFIGKEIVVFLNKKH